MRDGESHDDMNRRIYEFHVQRTGWFCFVDFCAIWLVEHMLAKEVGPHTHLGVDSCCLTCELSLTTSEVRTRQKVCERAFHMLTFSCSIHCVHHTHEYTTTLL